MNGIKARNAKGEGSFFEKPNGMILHRKVVGWKADGKRKTLSVTAATKSACIREMKKKEREWELEQEQGKIHSSLTLRDFLIKDLEGRKGMIRPRSFDRLECTIQKHVAEYSIGLVQIQALNKTMLREHLFDLANQYLSKSSVKKVYDAINSAFRRAIESGELSKNPMVGVELPSDDYFLDKKYEKAKKEGRNPAIDYRRAKAFGMDVRILDFQTDYWLLVAEALKQCKNGKPKYPVGFAILVLLFTGMRIGELISLRWKDINFEERIIEIYKSYGLVINRDEDTREKKKKVGKEDNTKNGKGRRILMDDVTVWALSMIRHSSSYTDKEDLVVLTRNGNYYTASSMAHCLQTIEINAGMKENTGSLHVLRRTFATRRRREGASIEEIAAYIGDTAETCRIYYIADREKTLNGMDDFVPLPGMRVSSGTFMSPVTLEEIKSRVPWAGLWDIAA